VYFWGATWKKNQRLRSITWEYGHRDPSRWPRDTLYPQKLALTLPTSGGSSVGIVPSRTHATEFSFWGFPDAGHEECLLLGCGDVWVYYKPTFRRNMSPPSSGQKSVSNCVTLLLARVISTLKMEATRSSETSVCYKRTPEGGILHYTDMCPPATLFLLQAHSLLLGLCPTHSYNWDMNCGWLKETAGWGTS
jgi:hypothetical protein